jgi:OHCU decarboxylase
MLNLAELNALQRDEFLRVLGPVFEHSPWIAERAAARRPFRSRDELHAALCDAVDSAESTEKLSLISAHPDLVGDAVLTAESQSEQRSAGLTALSLDEVKQFRELNQQYRARFDFPFVICARLHKKEAILRAFPERLRHSRQKEIATALAEIYKIADLRLRELLP